MPILGFRVKGFQVPISKFGKGFQSPISNFENGFQSPIFKILLPKCQNLVQNHVFSSKWSVHNEFSLISKQYCRFICMASSCHDIDVYCSSQSPATNPSLEVLRVSHHENRVQHGGTLGYKQTENGGGG